MKKILLTCAALSVLSVAANAQPVKLSKAQMDKIVAGTNDTNPNSNGASGAPGNSWQGGNGAPGQTNNPHPSK